MNLFESVRISLRALWANKIRSLLTMLGIIIGVGSVIAMVGIGNGATQSITAQIQGLGSNLLTISPGQLNTGGVRSGSGSANTLTMADVELLQEQGEYIQAVAPVTSRNAQVVLGRGNTSTNIYGTTASFLEVRNISLNWGRFFTEEEMTNQSRVAVVGPTVVQNLFGSVDTSIIGQNIKINNVPFQVIGITESQGSSGFMNNDDMIYIPITTAQSRLIGDKSVRQILVKANSEENMENAQNEITYLLRISHKLPADKENDFSISNQAEILETMEGVTQTLTMLLGGIAGISLLVGGIGIMNIMLVSVTERTREIGIRKAIGAREIDILIQFLIEAVILSVLGGGIGIMIGWGGSSIIAKFLNMTAPLSISSIFVAFTFSALIGIIFGVFPAKKASSLNPIEALRYE